jgi:hypothetical protein
LVLDIGEKERNYMITKSIKYIDAPAGLDQALDDATIVSNMLPSPADLVRKTEKEKITIAIDKHSLDLFRTYAK